MKRYSIFTFVIVSLIAIGAASCSGDATVQTQPVAAVPVQVSQPVVNRAATVQVPGQIESQETATISTRMMGFITRIPVKTGDRVSQGQILINISNSDVLAKKAQAQAMVTEGEAALRDAQKDYERYTALYKQQSASEKELENITLHYQSVKAKVEAARQMQREAEAMLAYTNITAPFSGVITQKFVNEGSMANPGMPLLTLEQPGAYQVMTSVSESEVSKIKTGAAAVITIKSNGRSVNGTVAEVSPSATQTGRYLVKVMIPAAGAAGLYAGMHVQAAIAVSTGEDNGGTVIVPASALVYKDQLIGIYTITEDQKALLRFVRVGRTSGDEVEILSGLTASESFISKADGKLYNGVPVVIQK
jgi:RND family efflux transporter MFP subunit